MGKSVRRKAQKFNTQNETGEVVQELGKRKRFTKHDLIDLKPKTINQTAFLQFCFDDVPLVAAVGSPGVGKTFLSLYTALSDVIDTSTPYDKIILVRSAVQTRNQGFIPGDEDEKMAPYERAYDGVISELMPKYKNGYDHLKSLGYLEFHSTSMLRSCTFNNAIIIVSEAQNLDYGEIYTVVSRAGENTKVIIEGDTKQDDLKRNRERSGLAHFETVMDKMPSSFVAKVEFNEDDIVRSGLVREFIIADNATNQ